MRLILSRKGFDSSAGGCPSPLFPDGSMLSLPIPDSVNAINYRDLGLYDLVHQLTGKASIAGGAAHMDPDVDRTTLPRRRGWRALLGQTGAAQSHLRNEGVGTGDLFLFFGLFRPVERADGSWRFVKNAPARHVIWGWLQADAVKEVDELAPNEWLWARYHPHCYLGEDKRNTLYRAGKQLHLGGPTGVAGAGRFEHYHPELRLTAPDARLPTQWRLPAAFYPARGKTPLSYHRKPERWQRAGDYTRLQCAARGQEFVLDTDQYPGVTDWLKRLFEAQGQI